MTILDTIKIQKLKEVALNKEQKTAKMLEKQPLFEQPVISFKNAILQTDKNGIIAEFKRQSPSKGIIRPNANPIEITTGYNNAGASALSVLTDISFFGAQPDDFALARQYNSIPILRKDFILDSYQILEAKAMGADVILLIAKMLSPKEIKTLSEFAHAIDLEVFLEIHTEQEILDNIDTEVDLIGINNRNLNSFEVNIENSIRLAQLIPNHRVRIAESGINSVQTIRTFRNNGFDGFLIGEHFMKQACPSQACQEFIQELSYED